MITPGAGITHVGGASSAAVHMEILLYRGKVSLVRKLWSGWRRRVAEASLLAGVALRARLAGPGPSRASHLRRLPHRSRAPGPRCWRRRAEWRDGWPPTGRSPVLRLERPGAVAGLPGQRAASAGGTHSANRAGAPGLRRNSSPGRGRKSVVRDLLSSEAGLPLL